MAKNRRCISITNHSTCHFAQEKNNHISNGLCSYALVYSYYRSSQLLRHTSLLTLAGESSTGLVNDKSRFQKKYVHKEQL